MKKKTKVSKSKALIIHSVNCERAREQNETVTLLSAGQWQRDEGGMFSWYTLRDLKKNKEHPCLINYNLSSLTTCSWTIQV